MARWLGRQLQRLQTGNHRGWLRGGAALIVGSPSPSVMSSERSEPGGPGIAYFGTGPRRHGATELGP